MGGGGSGTHPAPGGLKPNKAVGACPGRWSYAI